MTDTTHPMDAAIEAMKPFKFLADMTDSEKDGTSVFVNVSRARDIRSALPALTAYREGMGEPRAWEYETKSVTTDGWDTKYCGVDPSYVQAHYAIRNITPLYLSPPSPSALAEENRRLRKRLAYWAIRAEHDFPGDAPVFCGWWCEECKNHVEEDGSGHDETCPIHGMPPPPSRRSPPMSDHEPTHLIFYDGHFHEVMKGNVGFDGIRFWHSKMMRCVCRVGEADIQGAPGEQGRSEGMSWRNIEVDGKAYRWRMGKSHVAFRDPDNRGFHVDLSKLTGMTWDSIEKDSHKRGFSVTPAMISGHIRKVAGMAQTVEGAPS